MKFIDSTGIKRFVLKILEVIGNKVAGGEWLPIIGGEGIKSVVEGTPESSNANGDYSHSEGASYANGDYSHAEGVNTHAESKGSHAEGSNTTASGLYSHAQGFSSTASGPYSHVEGYRTIASGGTSHAQGSCNYDNPSFIYMIGVGIQANDTGTIKRNAVAVYVGRDTKGRVDPNNPKNGYQYLIGIGGYKGEAITNGIKSVQEVIADLEGRITALENR